MNTSTISHLNDFYKNKFDLKLKDYSKKMQKIILKTIIDDFIKKEKTIINFDIGYNLVFIEYKESMSYYYIDFYKNI